MKQDIGKYSGALLMFGFGVLALYRWHQTQLLFFLLLVLRDFVAAYFFLKRRPAEIKSGRLPTIASYISSALPLCYLGSDNVLPLFLLISTIMAVIGFLLVALATIELGTSLGISPAKRQLVKSGVYKIIAHPMYVGYAIAESGLTLINPINAGILILSLLLYWVRAKQENKILGPC
ncbi:MAG: hypothetical protein A2504_13000 [Bdellovibrionales bacterium RIFOXYD12_FULL_39_22]|nr:MAG: hypothetical protein A2385_00800 [Bdellovibrionales bacterium RIFOXYB1_FULL_39_21]OFZ43546.1 MAG: hypothetical protein A2485_12470 [Bdellovibrionales bacterium RIFOXYC12_FULL_39_17]OFZ44565.1 MAG: hypothetical protein A2404_10160 [Bdellovibrionales bacterium RIFOXYC1_FULL_39_130]OFZ71249.1 MAG: hypothetical protein A2451_11985 [Bdellovibrionales bacterium RIFOXYC2_FULL_39_8]OFZ76324.1 MAG: hypothetical protein A2560_06780 [Bdellovibrionales bacterium RIFOXYD1_FULL_39_84]OFZ94590.1 MAG: